MSARSFATLPRAAACALAAQLCACGGDASLPQEEEAATRQRTGALRISVATTGSELDPDGYEIRVDGGAPVPIAVDGSVTISNVAPGDHAVALGGIAANCAAAGANPQVVAVRRGQTTDVPWSVGCVASTGAIRVSVGTTGADLDADGYTVRVDGGAPVAVAVNGAVTISALAPGDRLVALGGIAGNCAAAEANPRTVRVMAGATTGVSWSVSCTGLARPPDAPTGTSARPAGSSAVEVTWSDASSSEDGFRIERSTDGGTSYFTAGSVGRDGTAYLDAPVIANYLVCYRVLAFNALGESAPSTPDCTTPQGAPYGLTAAKVDAHSIDLWWMDAAWTEDGYEVQRATAEAGPYARIATLGPNSVAFRDSSLASTAGAYWYRVLATRDGGYSDPSNAALATEPSAPAAPGTVRATPYWGSMADVTWLDRSTNEDGFRLERSTDGGGTWTVVGTAGPNASSLFDGGPLSVEVQACYRVVAFNAAGDSAPSPTGCTTPPAAPDLGAFAVDHQSIQLVWIDNSSVEDGYAVYRADWYWSGGMFELYAVLPADATGFLDTGLMAESEYSYRVAALKDGGQTDSGDVIVTTPAAPRGSLRVATTTAGVELDPDGYRVHVDGDAGTPIAVEGSVTIGVLAGARTVELRGLATNCSADRASRSVVVPADGVADVAFGVTCVESGSVRVSTVTTGTDPDPDGYGARVDDGPLAPLPANGAVTIDRIPPGDHLVRLEGVSLNCDVAPPNPRTVTVAAGSTSGAELSISCAAATRIAFVSDGDLYAIDSDGTDRTRLTTTTAQETEPAWSRDGRLAFCGSVDGKGGVIVSSGDGSSPLRVVDAAWGVGHPTWSPDGARIAYVSFDYPSGAYIDVVNADGSGGRARLTRTGSELEPAWSPDGSTIAFRGVRDGFSAIYTMNADGTGLVLLTDAAPENNIDPAWSPDGQKIAFSRSGWSSSGWGYDIHVMNADGTGVTRLTPGSEPSWSPDGRWIVFTDGSMLRAVRPDGTGLTDLVQGPAANPAWRW